MAAKACKANVGSRTEPHACGQRIAKGMLGACADHRTTMIPVAGSPGIFYRGGSYVAVTRHRGRQHKTFHHTLAEAREAKADRTGSARPAPQARSRFDEYARAWVANCQGRTRRGLDEDTRRAYTAALEAYAIPHLGAMALRDISRKDINGLIAKLQAQGLSPGTISKYLAPVRALFGDAVESRDVVANPALALKINAKARKPAPRHSEPEPERVKEMTRAELAAVLRAIPEQHRLVFELMAGTGCRISEALGLDWGDVAFGERATLTIRRQFYRGKIKTPKTAAGTRTIDLPPTLATKLWELGADASGPIFHTRTGKRLSDRNLTRTLEAARGAAGMPDVTLHTFRHTHGSILIDEGWTIPEVSERLGHASPAITAAVYAHKMRDRQRELGFLDSVIGNEEVDPKVGNAWATQHPETTAN